MQAAGVSPQAGKRRARVARAPLALALALIGAATAAEGGERPASKGGGGARGVAEGTFKITVQNGQDGNRSLAITRGYVTSSPGGIDCGVAPHGECSVDFRAGTTVTLTAHPDTTTTPPNVVLVWAGDCSGTGVTCSLAGSADMYVVVRFGTEAERMGAPPPRSATLERARGYGQCEIFLMKKQEGKLEALVYNTTPLNDCPPAKFDPMNAEKLAQETGSDLAWKNPRRFWMMDRLTITLVGAPREFEGLPFNFVAKMQMPPGFEPGEGQAGFAYRPTKIRRVSRYEFAKGKQVFLLRSPDKHTWVMQTYTTHTDPTLTEATLPKLGKRLELAKGWSFKAKKLDRDLVIDTNGLAHIVPDNLENMYQGCIEGVCSFDPWK